MTSVCIVIISIFWLVKSPLFVAFPISHPAIKRGNVKFAETLHIPPLVQGFSHQPRLIVGGYISNIQ